jgi:hypothetical protein
MQYTFRGNQILIDQCRADDRRSNIKAVGQPRQQTAGAPHRRQTVVRWSSHCGRDAFWCRWDPELHNPQHGFQRHRSSAEISAAGA